MRLPLKRSNTLSLFEDGKVTYPRPTALFINIPVLHENQCDH